VPTNTEAIVILSAAEAAVQELRRELEQVGYRTIVVKSLEDSSRELGSMTPALVLLDRLHYTRDNLQRARSRSETLFVSFWPTNRGGTELEQLQEFEAGVDDVASQQTTRQIVAKVRALLRRRHMQTAAPQVLMAGFVGMNLAKHEVRVKGKLVELRPKEFAILQCFLGDPSRVFSRQEILDRVWGNGQTLLEHTVDVHIHALRHKIRDNRARPTIIVTVRGRGYKLNL